MNAAIKFLKSCIVISIIFSSAANHVASYSGVIGYIMHDVTYAYAIIYLLAQHFVEASFLQHQFYFISHVWMTSV